MSPFRASAGFTADWRHFRAAFGEGVVTITLDRPDLLNALTFDAHADLRDLFQELPHREDVHAVVLTGAGRGFCSGGDVEAIIGELLAMDPKGLLDFTRMTGAVVQAMRECPLPVIALAADFRLVARSAFPVSWT